MLATKGMRFPIDVILVCIRWYAAYPLSYRHLEEMIAKNEACLSTILRSTAGRSGFFHCLKKSFANTSARWVTAGAWTRPILLVKGVWKYLYRAVDKEGKTVDFLLTTRRAKAAALRFFDKAMKANGVPEKVTMDKSGANKAAMDEINGRGEALIIVRQVKYLNNIVEQDHRAIKRIPLHISHPSLNCRA
ncbi:MAG: family transposase [Polaromonas sp.]|nr:family transposase [Polaromonas sp.]